MPALKIMVQGTGSYVGKSVVTAALCRYFFRQGYRVAPFKAQNMSNNSYVTTNGGEIGRAQAFQAAACGIEAAVEMNPVLLKPSSDMGSQVVVLGKPVAMMRAREYQQYQSQLIPIVQQSFEKLASEYEVVVIEGAGSPAEVNLRRFDIANMAMAKLAKAPVILVGDIHVGGVFAWLVGTLELLQSDERALVKAFVINKFRGDISLLDDGISFLEERTGKKTLGVLPFIPNLPVDEEDGVKEPRSRKDLPKLDDTLNISVVRLPRISNSTDFEAFENEPDVTLHYISTVPESNQPIPDAVILPGTKSTVDDLAFLRTSGLETYLRRMRDMKVAIVGVCGGFQMLGTRILDPGNVEASETVTEGLGFLPVVTEFEARKQTVRVRGVSLRSGVEITGYEIHMGHTTLAENLQPLFTIRDEHGNSAERNEGCVSVDGLVWGTYIHGLFDSATFRREFLNQLRVRRSWPRLIQQNTSSREADLDSLAALVREHFDCEMLNEILMGKI
jgi:adenosylcobyric acid synthase